MQLGGATNYWVGKGDTSQTLVVMSDALWNAMVTADRARWVQVLKAAHRRSYEQCARVELTV